MLPDDLIDHFMKWGIFIKQKNHRLNKVMAKHVMQTNADHIDSIDLAGHSLSFDMLGLSLILRMK